MPLTFDKIPSEVEIPINIKQPEPTVEQELESCQQLLNFRQTKCRKIVPLYKIPKKGPGRHFYKFFCVCPKYNPKYSCKHAGNIIIDRDVLTKAEHICYLAQPRENYAAPRKRPHFYHKKIRMPNCTSRIEQLALPSTKHVKNTLEVYKHVFTKRRFKKLKRRLEKKEEVEFTTINTALNYITEENRLRKISKKMEKKSCKRIKRIIIRNQRKQIRKIICVLFEEMKDFLLNDQFLIDERSTLCSVILEQIRDFTDKEFYTTSNLREYQHILANNLTVWINKFISNLNIHVAPPKTVPDQTELESYLPVKDYISCSESYVDEAICEDDYIPLVEEDYGGEMDFEKSGKTSNTVI